MRYEGKDEKEIHRDQIKPPEGWIFKEDWTVDMNRAVDEEGVCSKYSMGQIQSSIVLYTHTHRLGVHC